MGNIGFGQGLTQGLQQAQDRFMEQQTLKIQQDFNKARMKQMESEDQLKQLQLGALTKKMQEEEALQGMQAQFMQKSQGTPLYPNDFGPPNPSPEIDRGKLATLLQAAAHAGQDPDQMLSFMSMADPRIKAVADSLRPPTTTKLAPGETITQTDAAGNVTPKYTAPPKPADTKPADFGDRTESAVATYGAANGLTGPNDPPLTMARLLQIDPIAATKIRNQTMVEEPTLIQGGKVTETIKSEMAKPLTPGEARDLGLPYGTTRGQAQGVMSISEPQRQALAGYDTTRVIIDDIAKYSERVNQAPGGLGGTTKQAMKLWGAWTQSDPDAAMLQSKAGELASVARSLGEKGALADKDVARAAALVPGVMDTRDVARQKIADMRKIIEEGEANFRKSLGIGAREPVKAKPAQPKAPPKAAPQKADPLDWIQVPPGFTPEQAQKYKEAYAAQHEKVGQELLKGGKQATKKAKVK